MIQCESFQEDARKLAESMLDGIYNSGKLDWPAIHLDAKYECNYVFGLGAILNKDSENSQLRVDYFYQKNLEFYQFDSESSILDNIPANNKILVEKNSLKDSYSVNVYYIDDSNILCSDKQKLLSRKKSFDRNAAQKLAFSLLDNIIRTKIADYPSANFDAKYDCNYVFLYDIASYTREIKTIYKAFYQKNQRFYQSEIGNRILVETPSDNQVKSVVLTNGVTYKVIIYFLDNPSILCPGRSN